MPVVQGPLREMAAATHCDLPEPGAVLKVEVVCSSKASEQSKLIIINLYPTKAPNSFKSASYERTRSLAI